MAAVILETLGLTRTFGGIRANIGIDFRLMQGQVVAVIGPNGAGKSTFVGMVCGRIPVTSGRILFKGQDITDLPAHRRMGLGMAYSFQISSLFGGLSVAENVALALRARQRQPEATIQTRARAVLAQVGLDDQADRVAGALSHGHQRVLEIAMGMAQEPELFILDEPTQGLTGSEVRRFIGLIESLSRETTILLIEHNMDVVMQTAQQITVLDAGAVLASGTPAEIQANPAVQSAYLGGVDA